MALGSGDDDPAVGAQSLTDIESAPVLSSPFRAGECGLSAPTLTPPAVDEHVIARGHVGEAVRQSAHVDAIGRDDDQILVDQFNHPAWMSARRAGT